MFSKIPSGQLRACKSQAKSHLHCNKQLTFVLTLNVQSLQDNIKPQPCHIDGAIAQSIRQGLSYPVKTTLSVDNHYLITESEVVSTERLRLLQKVVYYRAYELRTFALIVSAHPYCARNSHATSCIERARALSSKVNNNRGNGHCYNFAWI